MANPAYFVEQFVDPGLGNASYLVGSADSKLAVLIDPLRDIDHYLASAASNGVQIVSVLETHLHADFVSGAREVANHTGAVIGASLEANLGFDYQPLVEGDELPMGAFNLQVLETPGHSPEHLSFLITDTDGQTPRALFSGGALTVGGAARTDLLGQDQALQLARQLQQTISGKILTLPDDVALYPTHGAGSFCMASSTDTERTSTIGQERRSNPFAQPQTPAAFIQQALGNLSTYPFYYRYMRGINQNGPALLGGLPTLPILTAPEVNVMMDRGVLILDVRPLDAVIHGHIRDAYTIQSDAPLSTWAGWLIPFNAPLILVAASLDERLEAIRQLMRIGYDDLRGYLDGGMESWIAAGYKTESVATLGVAELRDQLHSGEKIAVLDVRQESEWQAGHISGAIHLENGRLPYDDLALPTDRPVAILCASGARSMAGLSVLRRRGYSNLKLITGGLDAWQSAGFEIEH